MTRASAGALVLAAVLALGACGTTYVDSSVTVPDTAVPVALPPIDPDAPMPELLAEIELLMRGLDERIVDERGDQEVLARIDELWTVAERRIRAADPDDVFNFEQAIELARTGVERRRPADASKGFKIFADVAEAYLAR